jgi:iron complex transport system substrate-binding protein
VLLDGAPGETYYRLDRPQPVRQAMRRLLVIAVVLAAVLLAWPCCRRQAPAPEAPHPRIVSFSPALTTMLFDMHLGDHVVAVTTQDTLPVGVQLPVVGDAFSVNAEAVVATRPDMVVTNINVEQFAAVTRLAPEIRIEHFRLETLDEVALAMQRLAALAGDPSRGEEAATAFRDALEKVRARVANQPRPKVLFITDYESLGVAGRGTFLDEMIDVAGGINAAHRYSGWATITAEGILAAAPDVLICQVSPGPEAGRAERFFAGLADLPAVRTGRVHLVSDRRWTIPAASLAKFTAELAEMIHPDVAGEARGE